VKEEQVSHRAALDALQALLESLDQRIAAAPPGAAPIRAATTPEARPTSAATSRPARKRDRR
jgi:hypothetical protein